MNLGKCKPVIRVGPRLAGFPIDEPLAVTPSTIKRGPGAPPKHGVAMTPAERQAASRADRKAKQDAAEREKLITELTEIYDRQVSKVIVVGQDRDAEKRAEDRRGDDRIKRRQYLDELNNMSLEELRLATEGKETPDSRGTLPGETTGGFDGTKVEKIIEADVRATTGGQVKPDGRGSDDPTKRGAPSRWARVSANELKKYLNVEQKFRDMAKTWFASGPVNEGLKAINHDSSVFGYCPCLRTENVVCGFAAESEEEAVEHLWAEYYAGEKLWDRVDQLSDPDIADMVGPLLIEARRNAVAKANHHLVICGWLNSRS